MAPFPGVALCQVAARRAERLHTYLLRSAEREAPRKRNHPKSGPGTPRDHDVPVDLDSDPAREIVTAGDVRADLPVPAERRVAARIACGTCGCLLSLFLLVTPSKDSNDRWLGIMLGVVDLLTLIGAITGWGAVCSVDVEC